MVPTMCGAIVTLGAGGAAIWKRFIGAALCGVAMAVISIIATSIVGHDNPIGTSEMLIHGVWRVFVFTILSTLAVLLTELKLPEPKTG